MDEYPVTSHDQAEQAFREYENERWAEHEERWSPLITLKQLEARPDPEIKFYCPDFIPVGAKTIISAEPKAGKTTLLLHILKAVIEGGTFLGKQCHPARVLYLSEMTEVALKHQVREVPGLTGNENFYVLLPEMTPSHLKTWEDTIEFVDKMMDTIKAKILVVDTFGSMAKLPPGGENDSSTIQNQLNKLSILLRNSYRSIVLTHHNRKKSEDKLSQGSNLSINSARGSSAFAGGGDHILFLNAPDKSNTRQLSFYGRFLHGEERVLTLKEGKYVETSYPNSRF